LFGDVVAGSPGIIRMDVRERERRCIPDVAGEKMVKVGEGGFFEAEHGVDCFRSVCVLEEDFAVLSHDRHYVFSHSSQI
jgi:hypothetical protein